MTPGLPEKSTPTTAQLHCAISPKNWPPPEEYAARTGHDMCAHKAVYAYALEEAQAWESELGRELGEAA